MKITFIGTAGSVISTTRSFPAILINNDLLLDCGEGTTQKLVGLKVINGIKTICITHLHCDHFMGLFSLLWHYFISGRKEGLEIIGPPQTKVTIEKIIDLMNTPVELRGFRIAFKELSDNDEIQTINANNLIKCVKADHVPVSFAYRIERENKVVSYSGDTHIHPNLTKLFKDSDLLICEATYPNKLSKMTTVYHHCTPSDAAEMALRANCKKLVLFHISSFFANDIENFKKAAETKLNKEVLIAEDLMIIEV